MALIKWIALALFWMMVLGLFTIDMIAQFIPVTL
jgi:hypothetical protein